MGPVRKKCNKDLGPADMIINFNLIGHSRIRGTRKTDTQNYWHRLRYNAPILKA